MDTIIVKKEELVKAFQRWNVDVIENPEKHEDPNETIDDAEVQVDTMINYITEGHIEEESSDVETNVVANFIKFCKNEGVVISDKMFEKFFDA